MNDVHVRLIQNLTEHVFGADQPSAKLLDEGVFPANWVSRYVSLVESVTSVWGSERLGPREVVAAIHFASFYLPWRYDAWRLCGRSRAETESNLRRVREVSEIFLLGSTAADRES